MTTYETYTVAPEKELEGSRIARKGDPYPQVTPSSAKVMTIQRKCSRSTTTLRCALPIFTDVSKEGWGTNSAPSQKAGSTGLLWKDLDLHAFLPVAILGKVLEKFRDYLCTRIILIAPGWPTMPWFWDLVTMSGQIPLYLPNLLTQPFSHIPHRILPNLNLNVWLLEPQLSMSEVSLRQWQHELKLLRQSQPNQSVRLSELFL